MGNEKDLGIVYPAFLDYLASQGTTKLQGYTVTKCPIWRHTFDIEIENPHPRSMDNGAALRAVRTRLHTATLMPIPASSQDLSDEKRFYAHIVIDSFSENKSVALQEVDRRLGSMARMAEGYLNWLPDLPWVSKSFMVYLVAVE